jgi:hypothetical protein
LFKSLCVVQDFNQKHHEHVAYRTAIKYNETVSRSIKLQPVMKAKQIFLFATIFTLLFHIFSYPVFAASGDVSWAKSTITAPSTSQFYDVATDASGNYYAAGVLTGTSQYNFGNSVTVSGSFSTNNPVIVKYNSSGVAQWAVTTTSSSNFAYFYSVAIDSSGNVYAAGYINGGNVFKFSSTVSAQGSNSSSSNVVLVKYNSSGVAQWAQTISVSNTSSQYLGITTDKSDNVYAVGYVTSDSNFGNGVTTTAGNGNTSPVLVKYNSSGVAQWAKNVVTPSSNSRFSAVSIDSNSNLYAAGYITGNSLYNFGNSITATGANSGQNTIIVKYNSSGTPQWASTTTSGAKATAINGITLDSSDNVYAVGTITGSTAVGFGNSVTATGSYTSGDSLLLLKYNTSGVAQWAKYATSGQTWSGLLDVAVNQAGYIYAVGYMGGLVTVNLSPTVTITGINSSQDNIILVKYDSSGTPLLAKTSVTAPSGSDLYGVTYDTSGDITTVGCIYGTSAYNLGNSLSVTGNNSGGNVFIAKYTGDTPPPTVTTTTTDNSSSPSSSDPTAPGCSNIYPNKSPDLFQINITDTTATLFFTPLNSNITDYYIAYSEKTNTYQHGTFTGQGQSSGVLSYTIKDLKPNTTYYFRIRGQNGCMPGSFSQEMKSKTKQKGDTNQQKNYWYWQTPLQASSKLIKTANTASPVISPAFLQAAPTVTPAPEVQKETTTQSVKKHCFLFWCK